jgi:hypothetical protein
VAKSGRQIRTTIFDRRNNYSFVGFSDSGACIVRATLLEGCMVSESQSIFLSRLLQGVCQPVSSKAHSWPVLFSTFRTKLCLNTFVMRGSGVLAVLFNIREER